MIVQYGSFAFNDQEAMASSWSRQLFVDGRGRNRLRKQRVLIEGEVIADGAAAIDARIATIKSAFELSGQSLSLLIPPSTPTQISLDNSTSLSGVRVMGISVPQRDGRGDYATGLEFRIALEADYLLSPGDSLTQYTERITYTGNGGPRRVKTDVVEGDPIVQYTTEQTFITVKQEGLAVGILDYPDINPSVLPVALLDSEEVDEERETPQMENGVNIYFPVRWSYTATCTRAELIAAGLPLFPTPILRDAA